jgi:hypothetical protein
MSEHNTQSPDFDGYVGVERCIEILFPDPKSGIKLRMFRKLQAAGYIPYLKLGASDAVQSVRGEVRPGKETKAEGGSAISRTN